MSFESILFFVAIVLISAVSNWVKQRQARAEEGEEEGVPVEPEAREPGRPSPGEQPEQPTTGMPRRGFNWEEELKRLLEGTFGEQQKAPPPAETAAPVPAPPPKPAKFLGKPPPLKAERPATVAAQAAAESAQSKAATYQRARRLQAEADALLARTSRQEWEVQRAPAAGGVGRNLAEQLASPTGAQQAILASVVLGPPKAFEPEGGLPGSAGLV